MVLSYKKFNFFLKLTLIMEKFVLEVKQLLKLSLCLIFFLLLSSPVIAEEQQKEIEYLYLEDEIKLGYPGDWKIKEKPQNAEILRLTDERNNVHFSVFRYNLPGAELGDFFDFMVDHFADQGWEKVSEKETVSWEQLDDGFQVRMETPMEEDHMLRGEFIFFYLEDNFFLGRFLVSEKIWEEYTEDLELIRINLGLKED